MQRKIIQIANSTQLISLPRKWALKNNIKKGDDLEVQEQDNKLLIAPKSDENAQTKSIEVDVTSLDKDSLIFLIRGLYIRGYDRIRLSFTKPLIPHHRTNTLVKVFSVIHGEISRSTGLEIVEQKSNICELRNISANSLKEFDTILRRTFLLLNDAVNDLVEGINSNNALLIETLEEKHDTITKLILYNLRILNTLGSNNFRDTSLLSHLIASLDFIIDIVKNAGREIIKEKIKFSKEGKDILSEIKKAIELYYTLYYEFDLKKVENFSSYRDKVLNLIRDQWKNLSKDDIWLLVNMQHSLEILRGLYSFKVGLEY